jgi:hypothetical protein
LILFFSFVKEINFRFFSLTNHRQRILCKREGDVEKGGTKNGEEKRKISCDFLLLPLSIFMRILKSLLEYFMLEVTF